MTNDTAHVHIAFRFHTNFYHSYRGDTPDELGFGLDIRVIRHTIQVLDRWNASGIPVKGTWDIDNAFTLEDIMPKYCPDIIQSLQRRVHSGNDEINIMNYNNGLISAHTASEFDEAIGKALHNPNNSGLSDIFPSVAPVVRPQEMMFTPLHLKLYPTHGIKALSLFYSSVPFNTFSNFIKPLPISYRYNPLWLSYPGIEEKMLLLPAYNHGDIADWMSLRRWVKTLHNEQMRMHQPCDFLVLIDADADDEYWEGFNWPVIKWLLSISNGLQGLIQSVYDLPYVVFTTPYTYLQTHRPLATVAFGQDTADGSFDGYASWAEKWSNHHLWTGIERSRILELQTLRLISELPRNETTVKVNGLLASSRAVRLRTLSTTHFGLTAPIMNQVRLKTACRLVNQSVKEAEDAYNLIHEQLIREPQSELHFSLYDYVRGIPTESVTYDKKSSRALMRVPVNFRREDTGGEKIPLVLEENGQYKLPACIEKTHDNKTNLVFVANLDAAQSKQYKILPITPERTLIMHAPPVSVSPDHIKNNWISLKFNDQRNIISLGFAESEFVEGNFLRSAVNYKGRISEALRWKVIGSQKLGGGVVGIIRMRAQIPLKTREQHVVKVEHEIMLAAELPYLYLTTSIEYPYTESRNYNRHRSRQLGSRYDNHWREVMPCELRPAIFGTNQHYLRIWKHNYLGHISSYDLNYASYSKNNNIDAFNNHITNGWVAISNQEHGLLIAQTADAAVNFAFCPMRLRQTPLGTRVYLNPFGSYYGRQWHYPTAKTGLGKRLAMLMASTLGPQAGSFNGRTETIRLLIAPYMGDKPDPVLCADAEAFAYPYAIVSASENVGIPQHRKWNMNTAR